MGRGPTKIQSWLFPLSWPAMLHQPLPAQATKYLSKVTLNSNSISLFSLCSILVLKKKKPTSNAAFPTTWRSYHPQNSSLDNKLQPKWKSHLRSVPRLCACASFCCRSFRTPQVTQDMTMMPVTGLLRPFAPPPRADSKPHPEGSCELQEKQDGEKKV